VLRLGATRQLWPAQLASWERRGCDRRKGWWRFCWLGWRQRGERRGLGIDDKRRQADALMLRFVIVCGGGGAVANG